MDTTYQTKLRQLIESNPAASVLLPDFETATIAGSQGDLAKAIQFASTCAFRSAEVLGDDHPIGTLLRFFHGVLLARTGNTDAALLQFTQVINALVFAIVSNMPDGDEIAAELIGVVLEAMLADATLHTALARFLEQGEDLVAISNAGTSLLNSKPRQSCHLAKAVFEVRKFSKGKNHDDTLLAAHKLAMAHSALGDYAAARPLAQDTYEQRKERYGFGHALTLRAAGAYAVALLKTGSRQEALALQHQICLTSIEINGPDHPQTKIALNNFLEFQKAE